MVGIREDAVVEMEVRPDAGGGAPAASMVTRTRLASSQGEGAGLPGNPAQRGGTMERVAIVAHLKEGGEPRAAELIAQGPPFNLAESGIVGHSVYLSSREVVFVFEGHQVEWIVDDVIDQPFHPDIRRALDEWRAIVDEPPRIAREKFGWDRHGSAAPPVVQAGTRSSS